MYSQGISGDSGAAPDGPMVPMTTRTGPWCNGRRREYLARCLTAGCVTVRSDRLGNVGCCHLCGTR